MTGIKELLTDVAAQARPYDVTDRAVRIARRRRRVSWTASIAAVMLAAAGGVVAVLPPRHGAPVEVGWLPATLNPAKTAPPLPDDAVGPAALAYLRADGSMTVLTDDGRSYNPGAKVVSVSLDGRWIAMRRGGRLVLRDLTGAKTLDLGPDNDNTRLAAWSPNGRWVAVWTATDDPAAHRNIKVFDLETGRLSATVADDVAGPPTVCGLRDGAYLVRCYANRFNSDVTVTMLNPLTGDDLGRETVTIPVADATASRRFDGGQLMSDGHTLVLWTEHERPNDLGVAVGDPMTFDLDRPGAGLRTHPLPVPHEDRKMRNTMSSMDGSVIVIRNVRIDQGIDVAAVDVFDLDTDRLSTITTVSGGIQDIIVRGQL